MTESAAPIDYPWTTRLGEIEVTFRKMAADDREAILAFTRELPESDLLFLRFDITDPEVVDAWIDKIDKGNVITILAEAGGQVVGYCSLHLNNILWTRHLGEILLLVSSDHRGHGIGGKLARQIFDMAQSYQLHKLIVQMMSSQATSQSLFHHLGFIPEAMLHDWVIDRNGRTHDLIVMSREVDDDSGPPDGTLLH